jgi:hypothetical protein
MVAIAFELDNDDPENKTEIDHIDRCPTNDKPENLRWATDSMQNVNKDPSCYAASGATRSKKTRVWEADGTLYGEYDSAQEAFDAIGVKRRGLSDGVRTKVDDFFIEYVEAPRPPEEQWVDVDETLLERYKKCSEAIEATKRKKTNIPETTQAKKLKTS